MKEGSALQVPYPDKNFDLVFTSALLIHIAPQDLLTSMGEVHRCTKTWIWGLEYYAPEMTEVPYRDHRNLLWKTDYGRMYLREIPGFGVGEGRKAAVFGGQQRGYDVPPSSQRIGRDLRRSAVPRFGSPESHKMSQ